MFQKLKKGKIIYLWHLSPISLSQCSALAFRADWQPRKSLLLSHWEREWERECGSVAVGRSVGSNQWDGHLMLTQAPMYPVTAYNTEEIPLNITWLRNYLLVSTFHRVAKLLGLRIHRVQYIYRCRHHDERVLFTRNFFSSRLKARATWCSPGTCENALKSDMSRISRNWG